MKKSYEEITKIYKIHEWDCLKDKIIQSIMNIDRDKKKESKITFVVSRMTQYMLIKACIDAVDTQQR